MSTFKVSREIGGRLLTIETGRLAKQAHGAVLVSYGETVVLVAVVAASAREGLDFFPLTVDYREKPSAAGKFPGGFIKREGRPTTKEILTARNIDRPIRPLFPEGYKDEVMIMATVLAADQQNDPDVPSMIGASAALCISGLPFEGPTGAVRIGRVNREWVVNPLHAQLETADAELLIGGTADSVNMIEVGAREISEKDCAEGIALGYSIVREVCALIEELKSQTGKPVTWKAPEPPTELLALIEEKAGPRLREIKGRPGKQERGGQVKELKKSIIEELAPAPTPGGPAPKYTRGQVSEAFYKVEKKITRRLIVEGVRPDGRGPTDIRAITSEVGVLPRVHGSALFSRGETQALVVTTLGTAADEQVVDGLTEEYARKFMLHYNFPPFSTGEVKPVRGPGRREIGHGALAERSVEGVMPAAEKFPYTVRLVSDILESNGSSSMATVCGATLALMDAGVPIRQPVAGISIGWVHEDGKDVLLTDILGEEDGFGDMDFKVAGTGNGITGIQLDLKARGIPHDLIVKTLEQARDARLKILRDMLATLNRPRAQISIHAPRLLRIQVNPEKIGRIIGPGGKNIQKLQKDTGCSINIEDDGTVEIAGVGEGAERAKQAIELIAEEVKVGRVYTGKVISIKDFGAFVELTPGQDGLCHISELAEGYVGKVTDVVQIGDVVKVKVIAVDDQGRIKLSRKAVLRDEGGGATFGGDAAPAGAQREMAGEQRAPRREGGRPEGGREGGGDRPPRREGGGREGGGREGGRPPARETGGREGGRAEGGRMEGGESRIDRVGDRAEGDRVQPRGGDRPPRREGGGREGGGREGGGREGQGGGRPPRREGGEAPPPPRPTRYDDNIDDFDAEPVEDDVVPPPPPPRRSGGQGNGGGREGGRGREGGGREGSGREGGRGGPPRREGGQPRREGGRQEPPPRPAPPEDDFEGRLTDDDL